MVISVCHGVSSSGIGEHPALLVSVWYGECGNLFFVYSVDMEIGAETRLVSQARDDDEKRSNCVHMGPGLRC